MLQLELNKCMKDLTALRGGVCKAETSTPSESIESVACQAVREPTRLELKLGHS